MKPSHALLFSGHMIDVMGRSPSRFPPALESAVDEAIRLEIDCVRNGSTDVAISSAACGSDILFAEAVLDRDIPLRIYLPFDEETFLERSVAFADDAWVARYRVVTARSKLLVATEMLGPIAAGADPYERTNSWMLDEARRFGTAGVSFICVWNGEDGDGPGGTKHMMDAVGDVGGVVHWIDIRRL